jgi:Na+-driven multidrug efflux pump
VAWIGGAVVAVLTGTIGVAAAIAPALWMTLFTQDAGVIDFGAAYLTIVGGSYGFFGLGLALFFASQGAARMFWPLAGSTARLIVVALGGWVCVHVLQLPAIGLFSIVAFSLVLYAMTIAGAIGLGGWTRQGGVR